MLELLPAGIVVVGLIVAWRSYLHAFRELARAADDPAGPVVLTRYERTAIRDLERQSGQAGDDLVVRPNNS